MSSEPVVDDCVHSEFLLEVDVCGLVVEAAPGEEHQLLAEDASDELWPRQQRRGVHIDTLHGGECLPVIHVALHAFL